MPKYVDPKADIIFKRIFGEHPHLLKSLLNALLPLPKGSEIVELTYLSAEQVPKIPTLKRSIADVKCKDNRGHIFIVEMQIEWIESFKERLLFETGQAFVKQLHVREHYHALKPVYGIGLIATNFDEDPNVWYHHYQLVNREKSEHSVIEHLQLLFIELLKFPAHSLTEKPLRLLWLRFLRDINHKTTIVDPELLAVPEIREALALCEEAGLSEAELEYYESFWDSVRVEQSLWQDKTRRLETRAAQIQAMATEAEAKAAEAQAKATEVQAKAAEVEAKTAAIEAIGEARGEIKKAKATAKKMLDKGFPLNVVVECTGLREAELAEI